jgi:hypothetical protein
VYALVYSTRSQMVNVCRKMPIISTFGVVLVGVAGFEPATPSSGVLPLAVCGAGGPEVSPPLSATILLPNSTTLGRTTTNVVTAERSNARSNTTRDGTTSP